MSVSNTWLFLVSIWNKGKYTDLHIHYNAQNHLLIKDLLYLMLSYGHNLCCITLFYIFPNATDWIICVCILKMCSLHAPTRIVTHTLLLHQGWWPISILPMIYQTQNGQIKWKFHLPILESNLKIEYKNFYRPEVSRNTYNMVRNVNILVVALKHS